MPPSPVIHSIDLSLDRTDQSLLTDSLNGTTLLLTVSNSFSGPTQYILPSSLRKRSTLDTRRPRHHIRMHPPTLLFFPLLIE